MNPEKVGKTLGIGLRVAGRIAQQRVQEGGQPAAAASLSPNPASNPSPHPASNPPPGPVAGAGYAAQVKNAVPKAHLYTRAAGRGMGGFLRPFGRLGGILWLEVTGFFFGLFALYFARVVWNTRVSYLAGPDHQLFLFGVGLTLVFGYLSVSAFWRAKRK